MQNITYPHIIWVTLEIWGIWLNPSNNCSAWYLAKSSDFSEKYLFLLILIKQLLSLILQNLVSNSRPRWQIELLIKNVYGWKRSSYDTSLCNNRFQFVQYSTSPYQAFQKKVVPRLIFFSRKLSFESWRDIMSALFRVLNSVLKILADLAYFVITLLILKRFWRFFH